MRILPMSTKCTRGVPWVRQRTELRSSVRLGGDWHNCSLPEWARIYLRTVRQIERPNLLRQRRLLERWLPRRFRQRDTLRPQSVDNGSDDTMKYTAHFRRSQRGRTQQEQIDAASITEAREQARRLANGRRLVCVADARGAADSLADFCRGIHRLRDRPKREIQL